MKKEQRAELERLRELSGRSLLSMSQVDYLFEMINELRAELKECEPIIDAAREIKLARDERLARTAALQKAATLARQGGPRGKAAIADIERTHPIAHDISDSVERIVDALDKVRKIDMSSEPRSPAKCVLDARADDLKKADDFLDVLDEMSKRLRDGKKG